MLVRATAAVLMAVATWGAIVDGIVATVGRTVITDSMVRRALRTGALLAKTPLEETPKVWEESRNRLIEQALVKEEIRISRYTVAQPDEVRAAMEQVRGQLGGVAGFAAKLGEYGLTEADVAENVAWQITFSRFITYRFRPAVQVTDAALRAFYERWKPAGAKPAFEAAREEIEAEFIAEESSKYLDRWLNEVRQQTRIETLQPKGTQP
jgi:hypothetical protein